MATRETLCTRCKHRTVCRFVNGLIELEIAIEKMNIEDPYSAKVDCRYYELDLGIGNKRGMNNEI